MEVVLRPISSQKNRTTKGGHVRLAALAPCDILKFRRRVATERLRLIGSEEHIALIIGISARLDGHHRAITHIHGLMPYARWNE